MINLELSQLIAGLGKCFKKLFKSLILKNNIQKIPESTRKLD